MFVKGTDRNFLVASALSTFLAAACVTGCAPTTQTELSQDDQAIQAITEANIIALEQGATFPSRPLLLARSIENSTVAMVSIGNGLEFGDGSHKIVVPITTDGRIQLPEIVANGNEEEHSILVSVNNEPEISVPLFTLSSDRFSALDKSLTNQDAIVEQGDNYMLLDNTAISGLGTPRLASADDNATFPTEDLCICVWAGNVGKLTVDASCTGKLAIWEIPEYNCASAFTPAVHGITYDVDGYKFGSQIYKVDGSTCNTFTCSGSYAYLYSCVNNTAALLGKKAPYQVPNGTFCNEPPAGVAAKLTQ